MISRRSAFNLPLKGLLNFLFPPLCLHCEALTKGEALCRPCAELLTPLSDRKRCWRCFQERPCPGCSDSPFARSAAALPHYGPIVSVLRAIPHSPHLAKGCAGFLACQLEALRFPLPDLVVPAPRPRPTSKYLCNALSKLLVVPSIRALAPLAKLRSRKKLLGKTVLLVSDVWDERCIAWGETLQEDLPGRAYGMGLCLSGDS